LHCVWFAGDCLCGLDCGSAAGADISGSLYGPVEDAVG
jgi:hypothetical protein